MHPHGPHLNWIRDERRVGVPLRPLQLLAVRRRLPGCATQERPVRFADLEVSQSGAVHQTPTPSTAGGGVLGFAQAGAP